MDLRARLRALESRLGVSPPATERRESTVPSDAIPLVARLHRVALAHSEWRAKRSVGPAEIARIVGGESCAEGVVLVENFLPLSHLHGQVPFARINDVALDFVAGGVEPERERLLFIDTETNGLAGGTGTIAFVLGLARIRNQTIEVRQYFLSAFGGEAAMLSHALEWIAPDAHLVSFNGKSFDAPLLTTRYLLALRRNPLDGLPHLDLLHRTRAAFRRNWPDCRLQTAEHYLLKLFRTDDVPGHMIPQIWTDWLQHGDTDRLRGVIDHNRLDVLSLIALAGVLGRAYAEPGHEYADPLGIARAHGRAGNAVQAQRHLEDCAQPLTDEARLELAALYARADHWDKAVSLWEQLAQRDVYSAMERLAIYHEHRDRDFDRALRWTERMVENGNDAAAVSKRRARLLRRGLAAVSHLRDPAG
ncbi:MAG: ribonuclease H-like domain-containing protein [Casimicrobiaceae bacterium]